jgi:hypothetical protein
MSDKQKIAFVLAASVTAAVFASADPVSAADFDALVTKAPIANTPPPVACGSIYDFFLTNCPLSWYGVTVYGTVDVGGSYMTHGSPFDKNYPQAVSYIAANGGTAGTARLSEWIQAPDGFSPTASLRSIRIRCCWPTAPRLYRTASVCRRTSKLSRSTRAGGAG